MVTSISIGWHVPLHSLGVSELLNLLHDRPCGSLPIRGVPTVGIVLPLPAVCGSCFPAVLASGRIKCAGFGFPAVAKVPLLSNTILPVPRWSILPFGPFANDLPSRHQVLGLLVVHWTHPFWLYCNTLLHKCQVSFVRFLHNMRFSQF